MLPNLLLTSEELQLLRGLPHAALALYLWLRTRMNLQTGLVGSGHPQVSWQAMREDMYVEPHRGRGNTPALDRWQLWRITQWLIRVGLVEMHSNPDQRHLIFKLPQARLLSFVQKKTAPLPHLKPHQPAHRRYPQKSALVIEPKTARHQSTSFANVAASDGGDIAKRSVPPKLTWQPTYPQAYSQAEQRAILKVAHAKHLDADTVQSFLDTMSNRERKDKAALQSRAGFFVRLVQQRERGTYFDKGAQEHRSHGTPLSPEEINFQNEGGMQRDPF